MTATANTGPRIDTSMHRAPDGSGILRASTRVATTVEDLWDAITNPARLARWICTVEGDLRAGGVIQTVYTSGWEGESTIEACEPPRRLVISSTDEEGTVARLTVTVEAAGDGAVIHVEDTGLGLEELPFHTAGWHVHLEDLLGLVEHDRDSEAWRERWQARMPEFREMPIH